MAPAIENKRFELTPPLPTRYIPSKQEERKPLAMTIVAGFQCRDGIVLGADRQITYPGSHKSYERKISVERCEGGRLIFGFAGYEPAAIEAREKIATYLRPYPDLSVELVKTASEEALAEISRRSLEPLQLLIGVMRPLEQPELIKCDCGAVHRAQKCTYLGVGNSALIQYLSDELYHPELSVRQGMVLAAYIVSKAEKYVEGCGGPIDVVGIDDWDEMWATEQEIAEFCGDAETFESGLRHSLLGGVK